jgi:short-subunit dehydrogenase
MVINVMNIIIIGATSAIAQAVAKKYALQKTNLFLVARNSEHLEIVKQDLLSRGASQVELFTQDFSQSNDYQQLLQASNQWCPQPDLLLLAHGTLSKQKTCEASVAETLKEFQINCLSVISLLTDYANIFQQQSRGTIAVIGSVAGDRGRQSNYVYGTAKGALDIFLQGLRNRLAKHNVNVLTIKPGFVDTPMTADFKKGLLWAKPEKVASDIVKAVSKKKHTLYTPGFWRLIMWVIKSIPESIFKKLSL